MQYLLMIYRSEAELGKMDAAARKEMSAEYGAFTQSIIQSGHFKAGDGLQPTTTATTVRVRDGKTTDDGRSVRGDARATRRLLSGRGQGSRHRARRSPRAFPAPRPVRSRCGRSWFMIDGITCPSWVSAIQPIKKE